MLSTGFSDFFRNFFSFYNVSKSMLLEHSRPDTLTPLGDGRRSPVEGSIPRIQNSEKRQKYLDVSYFLWYSMNKEEAN